MTVAKEQAREQARQFNTQPQPEFDQPQSAIPNGLQGLVDLVAPQLQPAFNELMSMALLSGFAKDMTQAAKGVRKPESPGGEFAKVFIQAQVQTSHALITQTVIAGSTSTSTASLPSTGNSNGKH